MSGERIKKLIHSKTTRIIVVCLVALLLLIGVWKVFFSKEKTATAANLMTDDEARLSAILSEIEGVYEATVLIRTSDGIPVSAVILFRGQDSILVRTYLTNIASKALGIAARDVLVQPAN